MTGMAERSARVLSAMIATLALVSCASSADIVGSWREIGKMATLEFSQDGTFKAMDNQGLAVTGTYAISGDGTLTCEIPRDGAPSEIVRLKISVNGDEMAVAHAASRQVERYRRE
jgi:hypothetical protein